jgi:hypothetical protein
MAIVMEHTPYKAIYNMATQAGQAQAQIREQEQDDRLQLQKMQQDHQIRQVQFMAGQEQLARAEEMQYNMTLMKAKRDIDLQTEAASYARDKQKLSQLMNMINESDHSEKEKDDFRIQAMAKYADAGTGLSPSSFSGGSKGMQDFLMKGEYRTMMGDQIQKWVDDGTINQAAGQRMASNYGITAPVLTTRDQKLKAVQGAAEQLDDAQKQLRDSFKPKKKKNKIEDRFGVWHKEGSPQYRVWETMNKQVETANAELERLQEGTSVERMNFNDEVAKSKPLQRIVEAVGMDEAFAQYRARQKKTQSQGFSERHPILNALLESQPGYQLKKIHPANIAYEQTKKILYGEKE